MPILTALPVALLTDPPNFLDGTLAAVGREVLRFWRAEAVILETAEELFGLDFARLGEVADRFGPGDTERVNAGFDGVGFEESRHSQRFACGPQNVKQGLRKHDDKEQPIPSLSRLHLNRRDTHSETPVLMSRKRSSIVKRRPYKFTTSDGLRSALLDARHHDSFIPLACLRTMWNLGALRK